MNTSTKWVPTTWPSYLLLVFSKARRRKTQRRYSETCRNRQSKQIDYVLAVHPPSTCYILFVRDIYCRIGFCPFFYFRLLSRCLEAIIAEQMEKLTATLRGIRSLTSHARSKASKLTQLIDQFESTQVGIMSRLDIMYLLCATKLVIKNLF